MMSTVILRYPVRTLWAVLPYPVRTFLAIITGLLSLLVIWAGISTQAAVCMTSNLLPAIVAWPIGFIMTTPVCFFSIPALISFGFGLIGHPYKLHRLVYSTLLVLWPPNEGYTPTPVGFIRFCWDAVLFTLNAFGYFWKLVIPPFFRHQPSNESSSRFAQFFQKEPCRYYPPLRLQTHNINPEEKWIYINGVATNKALADTHCNMLYRMFERPIHLVHNPTNGLLFDFFQCIAGKTGLTKFHQLEPNRLLKDQLRDSLTEAAQRGITKVVLLAHSQGTIIASNSISELGEEGNEIRTLMRDMLEVYNFANCAHQTPAENVSLLENISNGRDIVAWLGHLFPRILKPFWLDKFGNPISITGIDVIEPSLWGHALNSHYLIPMGVDGKYQESKLVTEYMVDRQRFLNEVYDERYALE